MIIKKRESLPPEKEYYKKKRTTRRIAHDYIFVGSNGCKRIARFKKKRNAELFVKIVSFCINIKIKIKTKLSKIKLKIMKLKEAIRNVFRRRRNN